MQYPHSLERCFWPAVVPTAPGRTHALNHELSEGTDWKCTRQNSGAISKIFILNSESILHYLNPLLTGELWKRKTRVHLDTLC